MIPDNVKDALQKFFGAVIALIAAVSAWLFITQAKPTLTLMIGETDGYEITATTAEPAAGELPAPAPSASPAPGFRFLATEVRDVETTMPSFKGARVGKYGDALMPVTATAPGKKYWVDFTGLAAGDHAATILGQKVLIKVVPQKFTWPLPFYMEMTHAQLGAAHGLADNGQNLAARIALNKQYAALLRAHGIEPVKQAVSGPYPDAAFSAFSWKELVLDRRIAPPCLFGPAPGQAPTVAFLQATEAAIKAGTLPPDSWAYAWDEGEGTLDAQALARVKLIKQYAPSLKVMITRQSSADFSPYVDIYVPVINWFNQPGKVPASAYVGKTLGLYASCMSNGNCQNQTSVDHVAPATTFPMMVLDAPETDPQRFVAEAVAAGAKQLLYFNSTQRVVTALQPGGQYNEGGNGDGTLLYPNGGISRRLKWIRRGLNDVAWARAGGRP